VFSRVTSSPARKPTPPGGGRCRGGVRGVPPRGPLKSAPAQPRVCCVEVRQVDSTGQYPVKPQLHDGAGAPYVLPNRQPTEDDVTATLHTFPGRRIVRLPETPRFTAADIEALRQHWPAGWHETATTDDGITFDQWLVPATGAAEDDVPALLVTL